MKIAELQVGEIYARIEEHSRRPVKVLATRVERRYYSYNEDRNKTRQDGVLIEYQTQGFIEGGRQEIVTANSLPTTWAEYLREVEDRKRAKANKADALAALIAKNKARFAAMAHRKEGEVRLFSEDRENPSVIMSLEVAERLLKAEAQLEALKREHA